MIDASEAEANKWRPEAACTSKGDACCASGDLSLEQKIHSLIPKLNEVIYEILNEEPYHRATMLVTPSGSISLKQQAIIDSIQSFTQRVLHNTHFAKSQRRNLTLKG